MAYLRLGRNNNFDSNWIKEMELVSNGLADLDYCREFGELVPSLAQYLIDHGVKLNHHNEKNALLEFNTHQHFAFPEGGGNAVITAVFEHIKRFKNCDILWETEVTKLLTSDKSEVIGVKVRKSDSLLYDIRGKNVMLACGGFEGNREMLAKYVGKNTQALPLIPRIEVQQRSAH
jgi:aspartate oxidase